MWYSSDRRGLRRRPRPSTSRRSQSPRRGTCVSVFMILMRRIPGPWRARGCQRPWNKPPSPRPCCTGLFPVDHHANHAFGWYSFGTARRATPPDILGAVASFKATSAAPRCTCLRRHGIAPPARVGLRRGQQQRDHIPGFRTFLLARGEELATGYPGPPRQSPWPQGPMHPWLRWLWRGRKASPPPFSSPVRPTEILLRARAGHQGRPGTRPAKKNEGLFHGSSFLA